MRLSFSTQWTAWILGGLLTAYPLAQASAATPKETYLTLLKEYKRLKECHELLKNEIISIAGIDWGAVANLPENLLQPRYNVYNVRYQNFSSLEKKVGEQEKELVTRLEKTPLSDLANRGDLEVKVVAIKAKNRQVKKTICMLSVEANKDLLSALKTLPPEKRVGQPDAAPSASAKSTAKLPGKSGPSRDERLKMSEAEKINLMPVDDEFYGTQLGQKLEKDLGGKADFWSFDYDSNDLYVKVGNEIGKLSVREESPGIRYIRTRVGSQYVEPRGKDTLVDNNSAKGKFLTLNPREESLFGQFPQKSDSFAPEKKAPAGGDGHNHNH